MNREQMIAWLLLEGWTPYATGYKDFTRIIMRRPGEVMYTNGGPFLRKGGPTQGQNECTWDDVSDKDVGKLYARASAGLVHQSVQDYMKSVMR